MHEDSNNDKVNFLLLHPVTYFKSENIFYYPDLTGSHKYPLKCEKRNYIVCAKCKSDGFFISNSKLRNERNKKKKQLSQDARQFTLFIDR